MWTLFARSKNTLLSPVCPTLTQYKTSYTAGHRLCVRTNAEQYFKNDLIFNFSTPHPRGIPFYCGTGRKYSSSSWPSHEHGRGDDSNAVFPFFCRVRIFDFGQNVWVLHELILNESKHRNIIGLYGVHPISPPSNGTLSVYYSRGHL